uniref:RHS repeat-associated core domain-containing protein n=1 Tax=Dyella soli TaxID=522319 RepID=UPI0030B82336
MDWARLVSRNKPGPVPDVDIGLPGQIYDGETGHWSNGFRDYDPQEGRYLQSDPIGLLGGSNTYAYAESSPVQFIDPFGLCKCPPISAVLRGVGGNQAKAQGALYSEYPAAAGGSIRGGTFGTVAVQVGFLGLSRRQLRMYGEKIKITPSDQASITRLGGPGGALTVSDYGDKNLQAEPGLAFDVYRFPTTTAGGKFGVQTMSVTIEFPDDVPAKCPTSL